jgi:phage baseplate assembly protein W
MTVPGPAPRPIGWPLLPRPDLGGALAFPSLEDSVRQQIKVILRTRPGELLMHPDFGAGLEELLHEPNTIEVRRRIRDRVATSIARWEPRAIVDRVDVLEVDGAPTEVRVDIAYRLARTGVAQQLGLSMGLGG